MYAINAYFLHNRELFSHTPRGATQCRGKKLLNYLTKVRRKLCLFGKLETLKLDLNKLTHDNNVTTQRKVTQNQIENLSYLDNIICGNTYMFFYYHNLHFHGKIPKNHIFRIKCHFQVLHT